MSLWKPDLSGAQPPLYLALMEALVADVTSGELAPGDRLPTHRKLAEDLGVSIGTVTRAYREAEARGIIDAAPGRGTFVKRGRPERSVLGPGLTPDSHLIDLSLAHPHYRQDPDLASALRALSSDPEAGRLLQYQSLNSMPRYREAGIRWVSDHGVDADPDRILITMGAQQGIFVGLSSCARAGDVVLVEEYTYPGVFSAASRLGLETRGVPLDGEGMKPDALRAACKDGRARVLFLNPTLQNPTSHLVPENRRREIAAIAQEEGLVIIEDDSLRMVAFDPPSPLASYAPERTVYIASLSKGVAGGLRMAFVQFPSEFYEAANAMIGATVFMVVPLTVELGARWILDGTANEVATRKRGEAERRQALAARILGPELGQSHPQSYYFWMKIPEGWTSAEFAAEARRRGVGVTPSRPFNAGEAGPPPRVRLSLSAAADLDSLAVALETLKHLCIGPAISSHGLL